MTTVILGATFPANPRTAIQAVETAQRFGSSVLQTVLFLIGKVEQRVKPTRTRVVKKLHSCTLHLDLHRSESLYWVIEPVFLGKGTCLILELIGLNPDGTFS
uniref:Uncharacterized protein n=1 Tax=Physcomitrium patens TaxID=3218 RepID=A0A2K1LA58_PHYPA|nr:hypothetical protein PHYPA_001329 [Physcomitrium patens]